MSFLDRFFSKRKPDNNASEPSITLVDKDRLAAINRSTAYSVVIASGERGAVFADALVPVAASAVQAVQAYGMAVVKFPEGVGWADLCVRHSDGWKLLSNMKDGEFNTMAAIKQAGIQPVAVANLVLQGAAVLVGQAYMAQINDALKGLSDGVAEIQRSMGHSREADLESHFDALERLVLMFDEHGSDHSKLTVALQVVEDATRAAQGACHYEADMMREMALDIAQKRKMSREDIEKEIRLFKKAENCASVAFQLLLAARQTGMRLECDYRSDRVERGLSIMRKASAELVGAQGLVREALEAQISGLKGAPLALAEPVEVKGTKGVAALNAATRAASRVNPVRARRAAKERLAGEKAGLRDEMDSDGMVKILAERNEMELENLRFVFNEADTIVIEGDTIKAISTKA